MTNKVYHDPDKVSWYNRGYNEGYGNQEISTSNQDYLRGYLAGREQYREDQQAIQSGQVDHLSESEREFLFGDEEKVVHYR